MNDISQAATLTAQAMSKANEQAQMLDDVAKWAESNPYVIYGDYRDCISDEQAAMLLAGNFDAFHDSIWEWEINASDHAQWDEWERELTAKFAERIQAAYGLDDEPESFDELPNDVQEVAWENRHTDCSDMIQTAIYNWSGHVAATLIKRNGDYIEFPYYGLYGGDSATNKTLAAYLRKHCGIDPQRAEPTYAGTYLKAIGTVDLWEIYQTGKAPTHIWISPEQMTIGHEPLNGSGACGDDQYKGKPRWMRANFRVDSLDSYGIDSVFGLTGDCWSGEMKVKA